MAIEIINWECKGKFFVSLGIIFWVFALLWYFGILWMCDYSSSKYIATELEFSGYNARNLTVSNNVNSTINLIQQLRLRIPLDLISSDWYKYISIIILGVGVCFFAWGLHLPWTSDDNKFTKKKQKRRSK